MCTPRANLDYAGSDLGGFRSLQSILTLFCSSPFQITFDVEIVDDREAQNRIESTFDLEIVDDPEAPNR